MSRVPTCRTTRFGIGIAAVALLAGACGSDTSVVDPDAGQAAVPTASSPWPSANRDLAGSRSTTDSPIDASTVAGLAPAWTYEVPGASMVGTMATTPVIVDGVVWLADLNSNVYGVDLADGHEVLRIRNEAATFGPNGVAVGEGRLFVAPDDASVAAYDTSTGAELWRNEITERNGGAVNIQPLLVEDQVLVATSSLGRTGARGTLFSLDAATGQVQWLFDTIESPDLWGHPELNSGGGAWYPPAVDLPARRVYWGTSNPYPWPGLTGFPNGTSRPGDNRWTDSTLALDLDSGELVWGHQHRAHDLFDLDAALAAIATVDGRQVVVASGKFGHVVGLKARWEYPDTSDHITSPTFAPRDVGALAGASSYAGREPGGHDGYVVVPVCNDDGLRVDVFDASRVGDGPITTLMGTNRETIPFVLHSAWSLANNDLVDAERLTFSSELTPEAMAKVPEELRPAVLEVAAELDG